MNRIIHNDCKYAMNEMESDSIDMVYFDPPFFSQKVHKSKKGQFDDTFENIEHYLQFMREPLIHCKRVLKKDAPIWLHCDLHAVHYLKILMDDLFGNNNFTNQITWERTHGHHDSKKFAKVQDYLLVYGKLKNMEAILEPLPNEVAKRKYNREDERGRWQEVGLKADSLSGGGYTYTFAGHTCTWVCPESTMLKLQDEGRLHIPSGGFPYKKIYLHEHRGIAPTNLWTDIGRLNGMAKERLGYPTQKPVALLERIIKCSTFAGDLILDPMCGSGTSLVAAKKHNRNFIGIDSNESAINIARGRIKTKRNVFVN